MFSGLRTGKTHTKRCTKRCNDVRVRNWVLLLTLFAQTGCAHSTIATNSNELPRRSDIIVRFDINGTNAATAEDAVRSIRRHWISTSRVRGHVPVRVYVDNVLRGGIDELRYIRANQVKTIQYFNARDAKTRWGTDHSGGVIHVELLLARS